MLVMAARGQIEADANLHVQRFLVTATLEDGLEHPSLVVHMMKH